MTSDKKDSAKKLSRKARRADLQEDSRSGPAAPETEAAPEEDASPSAASREASGDDPHTAETEPQAPQPPSDAPFPIVGIGASAGGLEALEAFFKSMTEDSGMAFVVVTHTDPSQTSLLPDIIERQTKIPVKRVQDGMQVEPDTLYLPPSNRDLVLEGDTFRLPERPRHHKLHMPIDLFLRSLAAARGPRAACVILSGTGSDGTYGLRAVKERSGLAVVQTPASAKHRGMPDSALDTGLADIEIEPGQMPGRLVDYFRKTATMPVAEEALPKETSQRIEPIIAFIARRTRHDFSLYKEATLQRRIGRRMAVTHARNASDYLKRLHQDRHEAEILFQDLLIGVTNFFRDPEAFAFLKAKIIPDVMTRTEPGDSLRIWVPGCSTGEEVYSIAMLLHEYLDENENPRELQIFGTDIDRRAIEKARAGEYPKNIANDVSPERLERFFIESGSKYRIKREIREPIVFAEQNVLRDPPFSNLDLLVCRNLLIYLQNEAQERLIPLFHHVLCRNGILFLGSAESIGRFTHLFEPRSKKHSVFRKCDSSAEVPIRFPTGRIELPPPQDGDKEEGDQVPEKDSPRLDQIVENILLQEFSPACIVVNANGDVVFTRGRTGQFLELAPGRPNLNITDMAREGLRFPLIAALRKARDTEGWVEQKSMRVRTNGGHQWVDLKVRRFGEASLKEFLMVIFAGVSGPQEDELATRGSRADDGDESRTAALEKELQRLRMEYRSAREELETSNEELRSSNEELQSSNEELQSTNEELESSREELHSLNEELSTVNDELNMKIEELKESYKAVTETLDSTRIAVVFLDRELRVTRFTKAATRLIKLIDSDVGRPLEHIADNLENAQLAKRVAQVLESLQPFEAEVKTEDGHWYRMNILVHRKQNHRIEGVVLTFVNIDVQKAAQAEASEKGRRLAESIIATVRESLLVLDDHLRVLTANPRFYATFRTDPGKTEGHSLKELGNGQWDIPELNSLLEAVAADHKTFEDYRVEHDFPEIGKKVMLLNARHLKEEKEGENRILLAIEDISERVER